MSLVITKIMRLSYYQLIFIKINYESELIKFKNYIT